MFIPNSPIGAGDLCRVISGLAGEWSPNIGLIVTVKEYRGEHSLHGPIWRCKAEYAELGQPGINVPPGDVDFAQSWLKKIPPTTNPGINQVILEKETSS
jgi:hypothetical protein